MPLVYLGLLGVDDIVPSVDASISLSLPRLQAEFNGLFDAAAQLTLHPPSITGNLSLLMQMVLDLQLAISLGVQLPDLSLQLSFIFSALASLQLQIDFFLSLQVALGSFGVHLYAFDGQASDLRLALPSSFPGGAPTDAVNALLMVTAIPSVWASLGVVLKTS